MPDNDPRVFFAAERTLLAWVRTSLGLIGLGFVVARFGLFVKLIRPDVHHPSHAWSAAVGVALAALGGVVTAVASWQHRRSAAHSRRTNSPPRYRTDLAVWLGFGVALAGAVLAVVLAE